MRAFQTLTPYKSRITERTRSTNFAETHNSAVWSLCSLEARTRLNELGLPYGRKSRTVAPPLGEFSRRDYLRGIIDADGSVGYTKQGWPFVSLTTASTPIAAFLCSYTQEITGAERTLKRNARDDIYNILYTKENAQGLAADLYYGGCLSLGRKQAAADSLADWVRPTGSQPRPSRIKWSPEMDRILLSAPKIAVAAAQLGYSQSACQVRRWKLLHGMVPLPD
ncbi:LAGLIDADG family homing endonuclease [Streptomyces sp. enrichment culture]|uniref:LAGLIDADG family homing endonuclease n=1 Tax=Streptomyces sp. enrichment culture TaxID=1795815 RepID=UPI003F56C8EF